MQPGWHLSARKTLAAGGTWYARNRSLQPRCDSSASYRRCLTRGACTSANPCTMPPQWRRGNCASCRSCTGRACGVVQCSAAGHQEVLAHTVTIHRPHPLPSHVLFAGGQGAVGVRLSGGAPLGGRCATGGVGAGASGDRPGGRYSRRGVSGGGRCSTGIRWAVAGHGVGGAR